MAVESSNAALQNARDLIERENIRFINLQFTDIIGMVKSVTIPVSQFEECVEHGKWFDGSSIEGFARIAESDMQLFPDLETFRVIPWERGNNAGARIICHVTEPGGNTFPGDPRAALTRVVEEARQLGYEYMTGPELEFFLFKLSELENIEVLPHDKGGYFDLSTDEAYDVRKDMVNALDDFGIEVETSHHEVAMGQHEIDFKYSTAVGTADAAVTLRYTLKAVAERHGLHCTFMPKPIFGINGSGMHVHQSLFQGSENAFVDQSDSYGLSKLAKHFIAGQLKHAPAMISILAPTVNSYKRLVPGYEAPVYLSWARVNRSALIRVPRVASGQIKATRIELRCPDPSANPYLAFAVMLKAGLDGIKNELEAPESVEENLYLFDETMLAKHGVRTLPGSLGEAITELKRDELIQEALGEHIYERFVEAKQMEWDEYRKYVSKWEIERYLPVF
ncbi:MAG: type I glutamate--ammonia ligase [Chloroflexota bacterium]|nr:type I glutamate--ammonia ligase [Chloroflexota bacterium]